MPDLSSQALMSSLPKWLGPHLAGVRGSGQLQKLPWKDIIKGQVCVCASVLGKAWYSQWPECNTRLIAVLTKLVRNVRQR